MSDRYVVIENTPGYLPEEDEPATFEDIASAREYLKEQVERYCDFIAEGSDAEPNVWWDTELTEAFVTDPTREHDLGRVFVIAAIEPDDDDEPDDDEPDDDDAFITDTSRGYSIAYAGKFLGECSEWDDAVAMVREAMDAGKFWPNVWHINDHGNTDLVTIEPAHCGAWKPETHLDRGSIDCGCGWGAYCELSSEYVGSEAERFGIEQARALLEGTAGYETRQEPR